MVRANGEDWVLANGARAEGFRLIRKGRLSSFSLRPDFYVYRIPVCRVAAVDPQ